MLFSEDASLVGSDQKVPVYSVVRAVDYESWAPMSIISLVVALMGIGAVFWSLMDRHGSLSLAARPSTKTPPARQGSMLSWLALLVAASIFLLAVQLLLGHVAHSLTLLADAGHSAADTVMYGFAYLVERGKLQLGGAPLGGPYVVLMDAASALLSVLVVFATTLLAMAAAAEQLELNVVDGSDSTLVGPALTVFSCLSVSTGLALLWVQRRWAAAASAREACERKRRPDDDDEEAPLLQHSKACGPSSRALHASAGDGEDGLCCPCDPLLQDTSPGPDGFGSMLHSVLHPGCDQCMVVRPAARGDAADDEAELPNLNVSGATLHIATDVVRTLVMLLMGVLVTTGAVSRRSRADEICTLAVGSCVLLGSVALLSATVTSCCCCRTKVM